MGKRIYSTQMLEVKDESIIYNIPELLTIKKSLREHRKLLTSIINKGGHVHAVTLAVEHLQTCEKALKILPDYIEGQDSIGFPK